MILVDKSILIIHFTRFSSFTEIKKGFVLCGKDYNNIMILNLKEDAHRGKISSLVHYSNKLVISWSYDSYIKVWKL